MAHKIINGITGMLFFSVFLLVSCSSPTGSETTQVTSLAITGNWQAVNTTTQTDGSGIFQLGSVTTITFTVQDNNGALTITNFNFPGQGITWRTGTGNRSGGSFTGYITGYYYNIYNQQVDVVISFNGTVSGTTGNGTFSQTVTNGSVSASCSGTTVFSKL